MKNFIYIVSLIMLTGLAACSNKMETTIKQENSYLKIDQQVKNEKLAVNTEGKEKKDVIWLKEKALYQFEAVDENFEYNVFLFAEDEQSQMMEENSDKGKKGNQLFTGHYSLYLAEKDSTFAYKQLVLNDNHLLTFNSSLVQVYPVNLGKETVITVIQQEEGVLTRPSLYVINEGEINKILTDEDLEPILGTEIKTINQKFIQTAHLNGENEWEFTTWGFGKESMTLFKQDETKLEGQDGKDWYNLWSEKKEHYFPFLNLELSSEVIEKAKQGIPLGSPYPIGTNISNIKKSNPHYLEEGVNGEVHFVTYPEMTYYFDGTTGIVNAVSIPGERMKTTLANVKKLFGNPKQEININEGKRAIYMADKYSIEVLADKMGNVTSVNLRRK